MNGGGVLFLDEMGEFPKKTLDMLEAGKISGQVKAGKNNMNLIDTGDRDAA
ncbi:ATP-binding protein [Cytobacillus firmus]|uniref:ATP-binding protein n=1 Tax=Cytobacillus firmus TaxID=1399 RepID=UPI002DBB8680|nr:ATP-binding protein [Cytobacillus firmus]MEC1894286.1 ATP-binding protein [Cytobacillus firmus]